MKHRGKVVKGCQTKQYSFEALTKLPPDRSAPVDYWMQYYQRSIRAHQGGRKLPDCVQFDK